MTVTLNPDVHEAGTARRAKRSGHERAQGRAAAILLAPWLIGVVGITAGPLLYSLVISFTKYSVITSPEWIGFDNYVEALGDDRLHKALQVTFIYALVGVPAQLVFALLLAVVLNRTLRGTQIYRSIYYLPSLLGGSVAISLLWRQVFGGSGLVNTVLGHVGIEGPGWLTDPDLALFTLILLHVWTFGSPMVIFAAALKQVPEHLYEAAKVDGCGPLRQFRSITLPLLTPIIFFNLVLQLIGAFQSFTQARIMTDGNGGPADSTLLITLYLYQQAFTSFRMGYASAIAWILVLIVGAISALLFITQRRWVFYDD
ncbi:carbohydrate ABC transporter permease [Jiangella anatolica]|uniref:ABC transporter permease n=1 Tax=Jiangella anatolica TaxID=2670374 RepID=A0A2W2AY70_9ACTN|nr:sugar ABC transporter permease [Jiangella anatolica]PZF80145.1 ABC transporter permease [Jiangella anatolica]